MSEQLQREDKKSCGYAEQALNWYGWGSPIGLGAMLVCLGATAVLVRLAVVGV